MMNLYRAKQLVEVDAGSMLQLTDQQAKRRAPKIQRIEGGGYRALVPVQFKAGETFGLEGELPKVQQALVERADGTAAHSPATAEAPGGQKSEGLFSKAKKLAGGK